MLQYIIMWCGMIHCSCLSVYVIFCVYIEIAAVVWNSFVNSMADQYIAKYTGRICDIKCK